MRKFLIASLFWTEKSIYIFKGQNKVYTWRHFCTIIYASKSRFGKIEGISSLLTLFWVRYNPVSVDFQ